MSNQLEYINYVRENEGLPAAFSRACERIVQDNTAFDAAFRSQFLERATREDGSKFYRQVSEQYVSTSYDMADCRDPEDAEEFFWCDPATGDLHPVTVGRQQRHDADEDGEMPFIFASSDLIANGRIVGSVQYTDH